MRHDVTHTLLCFVRPRQTWRRRGRSALKLGCILRVKTTILPLATVVKFQFPQRGDLPPICRNIWPHTQVNHRQPGGGASPATGGGGVHRRQPGGCIAGNRGGGGASPATGGASPATGGPPHVLFADPRGFAPLVLA